MINKLNSEIASPCGRNIAGNTIKLNKSMNNVKREIPKREIPKRQ